MTNMFYSCFLLSNFKFELKLVHNSIFHAYKIWFLSHRNCNRYIFLLEE